MKQFLSILSLIACCTFVTSSLAVGQASGQTVLDESVLGELQTADEEFVTKIRHHVLRYFIDVDLTLEQLTLFDEIVTRQTDKLFTIQNRRAELVPADQKTAYQSAVEEARKSGKSKLEAQRAGFKAIGKTDQDQQADQQMNEIRTQAFETMKSQFQQTFSPQQTKLFAAITDAYKVADKAGKQAGLPKTIEPSQLKWYEHYKKQQNAPDPLQQLILYETEPALDQPGFQPLFNGTNLNGWVARGGSCTFEVQNGEIVGTCVKGSPSTYLCTTRDDFKDFVFTCEMFWEVDGNTGVMFRAKSKPGKKEETVYGPQAEMEGIGNKRGWSGGIYGQSCGGYFYPLWCKKHAVARHALKADAWNRITISARGNDVKTWVNGIPAAHWGDNGAWPQGFFGLQIHAGDKGTVRFRDIRVLEPAADSTVAKSPAESSDFRPLFNGKDLTGWDGDSRMWSVNDGVIRGETTDKIRANKNTFLIWDGVAKDFELKLSFRCNAVNNSGIQYRSTRIDAMGENKWRVKGYQHEIRNEDKVPNVPGFIYDEGGKRKRICAAGEKAEWNADGKKTIETFLTPEQIKAIIKVDQWNEVRIVAKGNHIQHYLNGELFLDFTDNYPKLALTEGVLALQLHQGKPMWVEFKDIMIRE